MPTGTYARPSLLERFSSRHSGGDDCWIWSGSKDKAGYGRISNNGRHLLAHRAAWILYRGALEADACVCHRCDNPVCVNPDHLWLGTKAENSADMASKGRSRNRPSPGEANGNAKINNATAQEIFRAAGKQRDIAAQFGVSQSLVWQIKAGRYWRHVTV